MNDNPRVDPGEGRKIYNKHCYYCHGYSGNAKTLASTYLTPPPRDFTSTAIDGLSFESMLQTVRNGRPGTAMKDYAGRLSGREISAVVNYVRNAFMLDKQENLRYHTPVNGWADPLYKHPATPFVLGEIRLDTAWNDLNDTQKTGKRQYLKACISCHDHSIVGKGGAIWAAESVSYPRSGYDHRTAYLNKPNESQLDAITSATPYSIHDQLPVLNTQDTAILRGERLYQDNCAFCHAADGSGMNWIGSFLNPRPRNLTASGPLINTPDARIRQVIADGLPGTSMPAWRMVLNSEQINDIIAYINEAFRKNTSR